MNTPNPHDPFGLMKFAECSHDTLQCTQCHARSNAFGWQLFAKSPDHNPDESLIVYDPDTDTVSVKSGIYTTVFKVDRSGIHAANQISVLHGMLHSLYTKLVKVESDAARWRYVRDNMEITGEPYQGAYLWEIELPDVNPDNVDSDVDAAIEAAKAGGGE